MNNRQNSQYQSSLFIDNRDIYQVMCRLTDLQSLARMAMTSKRGALHFDQFVINKPHLLLESLLKMDKSKIAAFLHKYPMITQRIIALHVDKPSSPHAFALLCLVIDINQIDRDALQNCIDYFSDENNQRVVQTLEIIQTAINVSRVYQVSNASQTFDADFPLFRNNISYMNLRGIRFENITASDVGLSFREVDFSYANLEGAVFDKSFFNNVSFYKARLSGARFTSIIYDGVLDIRGATFSGAALYECKLMVSEGSNRKLLYQGANFSGARFFGENILSDYDLLITLQYLPIKFVAAFGTIDNSQHDFIKPAVLSDLLYTVNHYTEQDYRNYLTRQNIPSLRAPYRSLQEAKIEILELAKEHKFFKNHDSNTANYFNDLFSCGLGKNAIHSPSQRAIQGEINRIKREGREPAEVFRMS